MANNDVITGLTPKYFQNGAAYNGQAEWFYIPSGDGTAVYLGDPVKLAGGADSEGVPSVTKASSTDPVVGVVIAVDPVMGDGSDGRDSDIYRAASTERYVQVATDPSILFEIQEDSAATTLGTADVGLNANFIDGGGSTITGYSGLELDSDTAATTATLDFQIVRLANRPDNEIGANAKWLVKLNNHQYVDGTTGIS